MTAPTLTRYICGGRLRRIRHDEIHVAAGITIVCSDCIARPLAHWSAFPDCHDHDQDHGHNVFDHRLVWAASAVDLPLTFATERTPA